MSVPPEVMQKMMAGGSPGGAPPSGTAPMQGAGGAGVQPPSGAPTPKPQEGGKREGGMRRLRSETAEPACSLADVQQR